MKLYATITSERATKGQGGNKYLLINLYQSNREVADYIITVKENNGVITTRFSEKKLFSSDYEMKYKQDIFIEAKAEKQKGERICEHTGLPESECRHY